MVFIGKRYKRKVEQFNTLVGQPPQERFRSIPPARTLVLFDPTKEFVLPLISIAFIWAAPSHASTVLSVGDGDTITVTNGAQKIRVRLACIDAPETAQTPYGMESRQALQKVLPIGTEVTVRTKATDRYGRTGWGSIQRQHQHQPAAGRLW